MHPSIEKLVKFVNGGIHALVGLVLRHRLVPYEGRTET